MFFLHGITILLVYQLLGEALVFFAGLPVPGPVIGMLLLFLTLAIRRGLPQDLSQTATVLLSHLSLLFVPAGVGVMVHFQRLQDEWLPISGALVISTLVSLAGTGLLMAGLLRLIARLGDRR